MGGGGGRWCVGCEYEFLLLVEFKHGDCIYDYNHEDDNEDSY